MSSSAQHVTPGKFEQRVANDLQSIGIPAVRVVRIENYGKSCPDVVQVSGGVDFDPSPLWSLVQQRKLGPLCVECKTRAHHRVPGYLVEAIKKGQSLERNLPSWIVEAVNQAIGYDVPFWFVVVRKKRGLGKGAGAFDFVICDRARGFKGIHWYNLVLMPYEVFIEQLREWWKQ